MFRFQEVPSDLLALNFATELLIIVFHQIHIFTDFPEIYLALSLSTIKKNLKLSYLWNPFVAS